jgi:hypothetical protein
MGQRAATESELEAAVLSLLAPARALLNFPALPFASRVPNPVTVAEDAVTLVAKVREPTQPGNPHWDRLNALYLAIPMCTSARRYTPDNMKRDDAALAALLSK